MPADVIHNRQLSTESTPGYLNGHRTGRKATAMTLTATTRQLAEQARHGEPSSPAVMAALQLAADAWLTPQRAGADELSWGLFGTTVLEVSADLFPDPPPLAATFHPGLLADEANTTAAVTALVEAVAESLERASRVPGEPRAWQYAAAAVELRKAVQDLP